jgi:hypothetical protein
MSLDFQTHAVELGEIMPSMLAEKGKFHRIDLRALICTSFLGFSYDLAQRFWAFLFLFRDLLQPYGS